MLVKDEQIGLTNTEHFKLVSNFSRIRNEHGVSCIYVKEYVQTKEQNCLQDYVRNKILKCP
jgi:hypothetical protein